MVRKPMNAYKCVRVSYLTHIVCLVHVSATLVAILRELPYKGYITKVFQPVHKCKILTYLQYLHLCIGLNTFGFITIYYRLTLPEHIFHSCQSIPKRQQTRCCNMSSWVLRVVNVFWNVMLCSLIDILQHLA